MIKHQHSIESSINESSQSIIAPKFKAIIDLQRQELIAYLIINNNSRNQHLKYLIDVKNIFSNQLPKMPKEYITRLVFDKNHQTMIILKNKKQIVGGLCFRQFADNQLCEIVFLAINTTSQIKGFGTRLMNQFKNLMQLRRIQYLLTYADNLALGYFKKQGFSKQITLTSQKWNGYIKQYQGGTKMQYIINQDIDYLNIDEILQRNRKFVQDLVKKISLNKFTFSYSHETARESFKRVNQDGIEEEFKMDPIKLPGIRDSGWTWEEYQKLRLSPIMTIQNECKKLLSQLMSHPASWPFRQPIPSCILSEYNKIISTPMDLLKISEKLHNKQYKGCEGFLNDIRLMLDNCKKFNHPSTIYYKNAIDLEKVFKDRFERLEKMQQ